MTTFICRHNIDATDFTTWPHFTGVDVGWSGIDSCGGCCYRWRVCGVENCVGEIVVCQLLLSQHLTPVAGDVLLFGRSPPPATSAVRVTSKP